MSSQGADSFLLLAAAPLTVSGAHIIQTVAETSNSSATLNAEEQDGRTFQVVLQ